MFNWFGYQGGFIEAISNLISVLKEQTENLITQTQASRLMFGEM